MELVAGTVFFFEWEVALITFLQSHMGTVATAAASFFSILGEQFLDLVKTASGEAALGGGVSPVCLAAGFLAAFVSGLLACKVMIALVRKAKLSWFALYCLIVAVLIFIFA